MLAEALFFSAVLFAIGVFGVLIRRNAIIVFMCVELMLNAVNLSFVAFAQAYGAAGQVFVRVKDDGIGIAPDLLPRVFDLFHQGAGAGDPGAGGLGLGLALVKSLVELHGGSVAAHSEGPGTGAEFIVHLPA